MNLKSGKGWLHTVGNEMKIFDYDYYKDLRKRHGPYSLVPYTLPIDIYAWLTAWAIIGILIAVFS